MNYHKCSCFFIHLICIPFVCLFTSGSILAQDESKLDTLDQSRYFPLQIGNVWEYQVYNSFELTSNILRNEIVADTLAEDRTWFVLRNRFYQKGVPPFERTYYYRYDTLGQTFKRMMFDPNGYLYAGSYLHCGWKELLPRDWEICPDNSRLMISGRYKDTLIIAQDTLQVEAIKNLGIQSFAYDIGEIESFDDDGFHPVLVFARIGERTYGKSVLLTSTEPETRPSAWSPIRMSYQNPGNNRITIFLDTASGTRFSLDVLDLLGRLVYSIPVALPDLTQIELDSTNWPAGIYLVKLSRDHGPVETQKIAIIH